MALYGSNRTFMELKLAIEAVLKTYADGSNRTFMELKQELASGRAYEGRSSNRTFMELKFNSRNTSILMPLVLIVPLWN